MTDLFKYVITDNNPCGQKKDPIEGVYNRLCELRLAVQHALAVEDVYSWNLVVSSPLIKRKRVKMIVVNRLLCSSDVRKQLEQTYGTAFNFDALGLPPKSLIAGYGLTECDNNNLRNPNTGRVCVESFTTVHCVLCENRTIVVDGHLHQIHPKETNTPPIKLDKFAARVLGAKLDAQNQH